MDGPNFDEMDGPCGSSHNFGLSDGFMGTNEATTVEEEAGSCELGVEELNDQVVNPAVERFMRDCEELVDRVCSCLACKATSEDSYHHDSSYPCVRWRST